jgi:transcriptional regulator with XRE-family HTH domain
MTIPTITLANRLTLARECAGISVNDMAAKLGVDRRTITSYEKQRRRPSTAVLYAYQDICQVPIEWLRGEVELTQEVLTSRCTGECPCQGTLFALAA